MLRTVLPVVLLGPPPAVYFRYNSSICFGGVKTLPVVEESSFGGRMLRICRNTFCRATSGSAVTSSVARTIDKYRKKPVAGRIARYWNPFSNIVTKARDFTEGKINRLRVCCDFFSTQLLVGINSHYFWKSRYQLYRTCKNVEFIFS